VSGYFGVSSAPASLAPPAPKRTGPAPSFAELLQIVWDSVHSGSGRTALADNNTDYYPVPLSANTLRPGTVYADPYGHILMIVRRVAQTEDATGIILAVDGQPDGTVARKRFWRGNFLFAQEPALGGPDSSASVRVGRERRDAADRRECSEMTTNVPEQQYTTQKATVAHASARSRRRSVASTAAQRRLAPHAARSVSGAVTSGAARHLHRQVPNRQTEHRVLAGPLGRSIAQASDADAARQSSFHGSLHEVRARGTRARSSY